MSKKVIAVANDNETTHFDRIGGDLLSAGFVEILEDLTLGRKAVFYSRPRSTKYFTEKAQEIHGISYWKAQTFPEPREMCISVLHWLAPLIELFPLPLVYHANGFFDWYWLESHFEKEDLKSSFLKAFPKSMSVSTLKMARENLVHLDNHKLPTLAEYYGLELEHHEAMSDTIVCAQLYCKMMKKEKVWTGQLDI